MARMFSPRFASGVLILGLALAGCETREDPAGPTGEALDEAIEDTERALEEATD